MHNPLNVKVEYDVTHHQTWEYNHGKTGVISYDYICPSHIWPNRAQTWRQTNEIHFVFPHLFDVCNCWFFDLKNFTYSWIKRDQLDVTRFIISLFNAQHVSDVSTSILRNLRLVCWVISWVVLLWFDVCWCYVVVWLGWCGIQMQAEAEASACIRIPHHMKLQPASVYHTTT